MVCSRQTGLPEEVQVPPDQDRAHRCIHGNKARSYFETPPDRCESTVRAHSREEQKIVTVNNSTVTLSKN